MIEDMSVTVTVTVTVIDVGRDQGIENGRGGVTDPETEITAEKEGEKGRALVETVLGPGPSPDLIAGVAGAGEVVKSIHAKDTAIGVRAGVKVETVVDTTVETVIIIEDGSVFRHRSPVGITPRPLCDLTPCHRPPNNQKKNHP
mmetsp:Transcript_22313/g.37798  ORF Transcript_22313/g.37798 Transcript_22313/m.37798 type:complete len:144 (+) Transcript_22313:570-1001(+)